jgi:hypothetical protein
MSTFLRRLLERSLASTATVQPRLASRFEFNPNPARPTEMAIEAGGAEPVAPAPLQSVSDFAAQSAAPHAETAQPAAPLPSIAGPPPSAPPLFASPSIPVTVPAVPPAATPAPAAPPPPVAPLAAPSVDPARQIFSFSPASSSTLLIEHVTERVRESYPVPGSGISLSAAAPASPAAAPAFTSAPPAPPMPIATPISPSTMAAARPIVPPAAAPIIRVTIGRVDIRAIHAVPPAPVRALASPQRPLVSLETYLKQRDAK